MPDVQTRTIRGVELVKVGTWEGLHGAFEFTPEHLAAAVEAHEAGALRKPPIRLGHDDPRFTGSPALGHVDNLRLADGGNTLIGDLVNVPAAVAKLLPHAYPDRSIEALSNYADPDTGRTYALVLTGLALLGSANPAVRTLKSLQDVAELYGIDGIAAAASSGRRVVLAADAFRDPGDEDRRRVVAVAAARRRRTNRINPPIGV